MIPVYAPTTAHEEEEQERLYQTLSVMMKRIPTGDIKLIMGDFNAKVGNRSMASVTGDNGLGQVNSNGENLMEFCMEQGMRLVNTWHKQLPRRLHTWTSPDGKTKNQTTI